MKRVVLIVDDEADLRDLLQEEISSHSFVCFTAACGEDAIAILKERDVSVILSDVRMPRGDGWFLLDWVRTNRPTIPVVMLTGFAELEEHDARARGAFKMLPKPISIQKIVDLLKEILG